MPFYKPQHVHKQAPNWLFPYLVELDGIVGSGRWQYWADIVYEARLPDKPIPHISFSSPYQKGPQIVIKHIRDVLNLAEVKGVRHSDAFKGWVAWVLHGLGLPEFRQYESPEQLPDLRWITPQVLAQWYEKFNLGILLQHPADYMAHFSQGGENRNYNPYQGAGFFATPMPLCTMMARMTFEAGQGDTRGLVVNDPCCGTGSLLLAASNYSLRLTGQDLMYDMVLCTKLNMYLYAPWGVWWPDFSVLGGPNKAQLEEMIFGQPEPTEQREIIQLPLFTPELEPALAVGQKRQPDAVLEGLGKAFQWLREVEEEINARRLIYADEYNKEWLLSEQMHQAKRRTIQLDFAQKEMRRAA